MRHGKRSSENNESTVTSNSVTQQSTTPLTPNSSAAVDEDIQPFDIQETGGGSTVNKNMSREMDRPRSETEELIALASVYIDFSLSVLTGCIFAELALRLYRVGSEYALYANHYWPGQLVLESIRRAFSFTRISQLFMVLVAALISVRYGMTNRMPIQLIPCLGLLPLYWLYIAVGMTQSTFDHVNFVREHNGLDYAEGMASSYYHGYLKLILPDLQERIQIYEQGQNATFASKKLIILIPNTLYIMPVIQSRYLEKASPLETVMLNRAGIERLYKNDVYRITKPINGKFYYVTMEGATPLQSYYDAMGSVMTSTTQMQELQREILIKFYKTIKRILTKSPEVQDSVTLLFYNTRKRDGSAQDIGEMLLAHLDEWLQAEKEKDD